MIIIKKIALVALGLFALLPACTTTQEPPVTTTMTSSTSGLMVKLSLENLNAISNRIVIGTVTGRESKWDSQHKYIMTQVTINVSQWLKNSSTSSSNKVVVTVPGGTVGNVAQFMEDYPEFSNGEQVLLFLRSNQSGATEVSGGFQGKYSIENGKALTPANPNGESLDGLIAKIKSLTSE